MPWVQAIVADPGPQEFPVRVRQWKKGRMTPVTLAWPVAFQNNPCHPRNQSVHSKLPHQTPDSIPADPAHNDETATDNDPSTHESTNMKLKLIILILAFAGSPVLAQDQDEWIEMFNGQDLSGWQVNEHPESVYVEDGCLVTNGERAHVFYVGPDGNADFTNFHFKAKVKTMPQANSGIYFHTRFLDEGWPDRGYEAQVNNTQGDPKKTGGLYNVQDHFEAPANDHEWFDYEIMVAGKHIVVKINGTTISDYTEPDDLDRPERQLSHGTFALQAHDPGSKVYYKDLKVKRLAE